MQDYSFETDISVPHSVKGTNQAAYAIMDFLDSYHNKLSIKSITSGGTIKDDNCKLYVPLYISCNK